MKPCSWIFLGTIVGIAGSPGAVFADERVALREEMRGLVTELRLLLPAAVSGDFEDPKARAETHRSLRVLGERAARLELHAGGLGPGARLFGEALARDAASAVRFFEQGKFELSAYYIQALVDDCVACHTRLLAVDSPWAEGFLEHEQLAELEPLERAAIRVATRRFDDALSDYESIFRSPASRADLLLDPLGVCLTVALRTARDLKRAHALVDELAKREGLPRIPREDLETWRDRLAELQQEDLNGTTLPRARAAVKTAMAAASYPGDPTPWSTISSPRRSSINCAGARSPPRPTPPRSTTSSADRSWAGAESPRAEILALIGWARPARRTSVSRDASVGGVLGRSGNTRRGDGLSRGAPALRRRPRGRSCNPQAHAGTSPQLAGQNRERRARARRTLTRVVPSPVEGVLGCESTARATARPR